MVKAQAEGEEYGCGIITGGFNSTIQNWVCLISLQIVAKGVISYLVVARMAASQPPHANQVSSWTSTTSFANPVPKAPTKANTATHDASSATTNPPTPTTAPKRTQTYSVTSVTTNAVFLFII